jgi:KTSC domain
MNGQRSREPQLPKMLPVKSSHIAAAGHDPVAKNLTIAFHNGDLYQYRGVATGTYQSMLAAQSAGQFFNAKIKGRYLATKLKDHRLKR